MLSSPLLEQIGGYIGGGWAAVRSGGVLDVRNPATGELLAQVPAMAADDAATAIEAAAAAQGRPVPLAQRREWLLAITDLLRANRAELGRIITLEQGKPWPEAQAEVDYAAGFFQYCADHAHLLEPQVIPEQPRGCAWTVYYRPAGVAGLITPWNFPLALMAKKLSAALLAGCACVMKPAEQTPLTMVAFTRLVHDALELPSGALNLVIGPPEPIGETLCSHPAVRIISFTGSTTVGKWLMHKSAQEVQRLTLELGGNAPFIVLADANLDQAADQLIANKFRAAGQTCVCTNRVLLQRNVAGEFAAKVADRAARLNVGDGMAEGTDIGPLINRAGFDKVSRHLNDALERGAVCIAGGNPEPPPGDWGCFFPPTVLRGVLPDMACAREETFGPLVPLIEFETADEALAMANATESGLAAYLFTQDESRAREFIARLQFGHVGLNTGTGPAPEAPFGGMKHSGYGREGGREGLFEFTSPQTVPAPRGQA